MTSKEKAIFGVFLGLAALLVFAVRHHIFFWDTIQLGSKHAHWYYENSFQYLLLPDEIDSGHPPAFGMYLALIWSLFGKSLLVSHFAMLPFIWGILYYLFKLGGYYTGPDMGWLMVLFVVADPVLAGQLVLVSPDLVLVLGFLMAWWGIITQQQGLKVVAFLLMAIISTRGMMVVFSLFLFECIFENRWHWKMLLQRILPYLPAGLIAIAFLAYHYYEKGWIGYHADSPWSPGFQRVGLKGAGHNVLILGFRFLDFGRIFIWIAGLIALVYGWRKKRRELPLKIKGLLLLFLIQTFFLSITFLLYQGLQSHRYLLPAFIALNVLVFTLIVKSDLKEKFKRLYLAVAIIGLATGNLWIYPDKVSQDWDCTLAHLPYYQLREDALSFLRQEQIPISEVGTAFPDVGPLKYKALTEQTEGFKTKNLETDQWILYSNVMNDYTDDEIDSLRSKWEVIRTWKKRGVKFILYRNKLIE